MLKGAALTETVYPHGTRLLNDFDILINKRDYIRVVDAFAAHGFAKVFRADRSEAQELDSYHQMALTKTLGGSQLTIDLHWLMYPAERTFCQIDTPFTHIARETGSGRIDTMVRPFHRRHARPLQLANRQRFASRGLPAHGGYICCCEEFALLGFDCPTSPDGRAPRLHARRAVNRRHAGCKRAGVGFNRLWRACLGCNVSSTYLAVPAAGFPQPDDPGCREADTRLPSLQSVAERISYLRVFVASNWHTSRRRRGVLRSCLHAGRYVSNAAVWSLRLLTTSARWRRDV